MAFLTAVGRLALTLLSCAVFPFAAQGQAVDEYQVKAAYLYNFAKFVEWPAQTFAGPNDPIRFCVLGQNPFAGSLESTLSGKTVDGRPLALKQLSYSHEAAMCQVLFISSSEKKHLRTILSELNSRSVLTVGETDDFTTAGGMVRFFLDGGRVRLEFNPHVASDARLHLSAKLLSLGTVVRKAER